MQIRAHRQFLQEYDAHPAWQRKKLARSFVELTSDIPLHAGKFVHRRRTCGTRTESSYARRGSYFAAAPPWTQRHFPLSTQPVVQQTAARQLLLMPRCCAGRLFHVDCTLSEPSDTVRLHQWVQLGQRLTTCRCAYCTSADCVAACLPQQEQTTNAGIQHRMVCRHPVSMKASKGTLAHRCSCSRNRRHGPPPDGAGRRRQTHSGT